MGRAVVSKIPLLFMTPSMDQGYHYNEPRSAKRDLSPSSQKGKKYTNSWPLPTRRGPNLITWAIKITLLSRPNQDQLGTD